MPLNFHPEPGTILVCDFNGLVVPEMVKRRCVVVISPRFRDRGELCTVVPLSTTDPPRVEPYHMRLRFDPPLPRPYESEYKWVKGDMLYTVRLGRLSLPFCGKDPSGNRIYHQRIVTPAELASIRECVAAGLGISMLTGRP